MADRHAPEKERDLSVEESGSRRETSPEGSSQIVGQCRVPLADAVAAEGHDAAQAEPFGVCGCCIEREDCERERGRASKIAR